MYGCTNIPYCTVLYWIVLYSACSSKILDPEGRLEGECRRKGYSAVHVLDVIYSAAIDIYIRNNRGSDEGNMWPRMSCTDDINIT